MPPAIEKVEGPSMQLNFQKITVDTIRMEARLPPDKLARIKQMTTSWLNKKNATKRDLLGCSNMQQK